MICLVFGAAAAAEQNDGGRRTVAKERVTESKIFSATRSAQGGGTKMARISYVCGGCELGTAFCSNT